MVVLGAGGRLGRLLRPFWAGATFQSREARRASPGGCLDPLADPGGLARVVSGARAVVVLSGVTGGPPEVLALNTTLAVAALEAAARGGAQRVLIASTAAVYGGGGPFAEEAPAAPTGAYGAAKAAMEDAVRDWVARRGAGAPVVAILRIANVAGADWLLGSGAGPVALHRCAGGRGPRRSYIGPDALARAITALAAGPRPPAVLNISAPGSVAMGDLARAAGRTVIWRDGPAETPERVEIDPARLWTFLGAHPPAADAAALVAAWRALATEVAA
jgi:nucleoside-diphosphate-sugar epimerase